jgi:hypothetical protein
MGLSAMKMVIRICVILHNMIIDFLEHANNIDPTYINEDEYVPLHPFRIMPCNHDQTGMIHEMQHVEIHHQLQHNLMLEMWEKWND